MNTSVVVVDALCYGFRVFGQLRKDPFSSILDQFCIPYSTFRSVKFVVFSWSKSYSILDDGRILARGFIGTRYTELSMFLPSDDRPKKVLFLKDHDLFLTEEGLGWEYYGDGKWLGPVSFPKAKEASCKMLRVQDALANDDVILFTLFDKDVYCNRIDRNLILPSTVKKICCGFEHNVCLLSNGSVYVWGSGSRGQLGNGSLIPIENPQLLDYLGGLIVIDVDAGGWHTAAVASSGDLYTWGWNNFGQLGFPSDQNVELDDTSYISVLIEPKLVEWPDNLEVIVKQIACGNTHTLTLCDDGTVWGCGNNKFGQIDPLQGQNSLDKMSLVPVPKNVDRVHRISCSFWNTVLYVSYKK